MHQSIIPTRTICEAPRPWTAIVTSGTNNFQSAYCTPSEPFYNNNCKSETYQSTCTIEDRQQEQCISTSYDNSNENQLSCKYSDQKEIRQADRFEGTGNGIEAEHELYTEIEEEDKGNLHVKRTTTYENTMEFISPDNIDSLSCKRNTQQIIRKTLNQQEESYVTEVPCKKHEHQELFVGEEMQSSNNKFSEVPECVNIEKENSACNRHSELEENVSNNQYINSNELIKKHYKKQIEDVHQCVKKQQPAKLQQTLQERRLSSKLEHQSQQQQQNQQAYLTNKKNMQFGKQMEDVKITVPQYTKTDTKTHSCPLRLTSNEQIMTLKDTKCEKQKECSIFYGCSRSVSPFVTALTTASNRPYMPLGREIDLNATTFRRCKTVAPDIQVTSEGHSTPSELLYCNLHNEDVKEREDANPLSTLPPDYQSCRCSNPCSSCSVHSHQPSSSALSCDIKPSNRIGSYQMYLNCEEQVDAESKDYSPSRTSAHGYSDPPKLFTYFHKSRFQSIATPNKPENCYNNYEEDRPGVQKSKDIISSKTMHFNEDEESIIEKCDGTGSSGNRSGNFAGNSIPNRGRGILNQAGSELRVPLCAVCNSQVRGPFISALGQIWCPEHFVCANSQCGRTLQDIGFVEEKDNLYCEYCFERFIAPSCNKCNTKIKGDCLNAVGKHFHPECFNCTFCGKHFGNNPFFLEEGLPYCESDWNDLFTTKCFACGFPVEAGDRWVEALSNNYHSQCFNCTMCKMNLEGQTFYAKGGRPFCKNHAR